MERYSISGQSAGKVARSLLVEGEKAARPDSGIFSQVLRRQRLNQLLFTQTGKNAHVIPCLPARSQDEEDKLTKEVRSRICMKTGLRGAEFLHSHLKSCWLTKDRVGDEIGIVCRTEKHVILVNVSMNPLVFAIWMSCTHPHVLAYTRTIRNHRDIILA